MFMLVSDPNDGAVWLQVGGLENKKEHIRTALINYLLDALYDRVIILRALGCGQENRGTILKPGTLGYLHRHKTTATRKNHTYESF